MQQKLTRAYLVECVGTFGLVYFATAVAILNLLTLPTSADTAEVGTTALTMHQPGIVGIALAQALIFGALLSLTLPISGGYLNPAVTVMLWVFNRMETKRAAWLIGAQLVGSVAACVFLYFTFTEDLLKAAHFGTPHANTLAYGPGLVQRTLYAGTAVELVLTFFLVYAIFAAVRDPIRSAQTAWIGGAVLGAAVLVGYPLTGAALNPARWFGPVLFESRVVGSNPAGHSPFAEALIYTAGPILGALIGGLFTFKLYWPTRTAEEATEKAGDAGTQEAGVASAETSIKVQKKGHR